MTNSTMIYRRGSDEGFDTVTVMAYIGAAAGDSDEIRVIIDRDGETVQDGIAYFGRSGDEWLRERHAALLADGYRPAAF